MATFFCAQGQEDKSNQKDHQQIPDQWNNSVLYFSKPEMLTQTNPVPHLIYESDQNNYPPFFDYWNKKNLWDEVGPLTSSNNNTDDVGRLSCIEIDPINDSIVLAGSPSGGLYYTFDKGNSWINAGLDRPMEEHGLNFFTPGISSIIIIHENGKTYWILATGDKDHVFSSSKGVIRSTDFGNNWHLLNGIQPEHLPESDYYIRKLVKHPDNPNVLFAATSRGIYKTSNALAENPEDVKWLKILDDPDSNGEGYFDLEFHKTQPNIIIASKEYREANTIVGDEIIWSTDGGDNWEPFPNINEILPIGTEFTFFLSLLELTQANENLMYVYTKGKEKSDYFNIFRKYNFTDSSWSHLDTIHYKYGNGRNGFAASPVDENLIYCATVDTYCSTDGGNSWQWDNDVFEIDGEYKRFPHSDIQELKFNKEGTEVWAASDGGPFLKILKDSIWINKVNNIGLAIILKFDNSEIDPDKYLFGGWDVGSQLYSKNQNKWKHLGSGDGYGCAFDNEENGTFYTVGYIYNHNNIYSFKNWTTDSVLKYGNFWHANIVINPVNHKTLYLSLGDKIARSFNQGESWEILVTVEDLGLEVGQHILLDIHVAESNGNYLYLQVVNVKGGEGHRIYKSENANASRFSIQWNDISPQNMPSSWFTDIAVNDRNQDNIWASFSGSGDTKIMEYRDDIWTNITGNLQSYNSGVYTIAHLKGTSGGLFAGTYYGTFYRENETKNWKLYKPGLPNVKPVDLKINHKSGKIVIGLDGRGIWETDLPEGYIAPDNYSTSDSKVKIYPNPVTDDVNVQMLIKNINGVDINIFDIDGKLVIDTWLQQQVQNKQLDLFGLNQGIYIIQCKYNGEIIGREKLMILH